MFVCADCGAPKEVDRACANCGGSRAVEHTASQPSIMTALMSMMSDCVPEKVTRFERIVCALIRCNQFHGTEAGIDEMLIAANQIVHGIDAHEMRSHAPTSRDDMQQFGTLDEEH